jgi:SAM-dependent methyltransferase
MKIDHEEIYRDGKHYDALNNFNHDVPFYLKMAKSFGDKTLELACGTGRITLPLAKQGIDIVGLDISNGMIREAKEKANKQNLDIELLIGDVRDFNLERKFSLIIFPFNSICHLHDYESIKACFENVKKHLHPDGRFIIDVFKPNFNFLLRDSKERAEVSTYNNPYGNNKVRLTESNNYDQISQINYINWFYNTDGKERGEELNMRMFFPQELENYLRFTGFQIENKFGDYDLSSFKNNSEKQIIISKLK